MRIAQVAPLAESVPPKLYGGTERVVSWLTEELVSLGCDVTLFASGDLSTSATLVPVCPGALRLSRPPIDPAAASAALLDTVAEMASGFDVIHCHLEWVHLPVLRRLGVPYITTIHVRIDQPCLSSLTRSFASAPLVSISDHQRIPLPDLNWVGTIYLRCYEALSSRRENISIPPSITPDQGRAGSNQVVAF